MDDVQRLGIVLRHLIEHNEGHAEDYARWIELAKNNRLTQVAELISEASRQMSKASEALKAALDHLGGPPADDEHHHHH
jgi:triacylglycerol esterase/lipase EstA (alpha/beta hydrolase family)